MKFCHFILVVGCFILPSIALADFNNDLLEQAKIADCSFRDIDEIRSGNPISVARAFLQEKLVVFQDSKELQEILPELSRLEREFLSSLFSPSEAARLKSSMDNLALKVMFSADPNARVNALAIKSRPCILAKIGYLQKNRLPADANDSRANGNERYRLKDKQDFLEFNPDLMEVTIYRPKIQFCHDSELNRLFVERRYFGIQKINLTNINAIPSEERESSIVLECSKHIPAVSTQPAN
jgi:hypothetical protein